MANLAFQEYIEKLSRQKVLIFGLGLQGGGVDSAKFFLKYAKEVKITDLKTEKELKPSLAQLKNFSYSLTLGEHRDEDIQWADLIVVNQDIWNKSPDSHFLQLAYQLDKQIETQIGLFFRFCDCPIIGITGTRGKTTTTYACFKMLQDNGFKVILGGNVPHTEILNQLENSQDLDFAILELSNFQLHALHLEKKSPHIAIVTSIYPDHLISYAGENFEEQMQNYIKDKTAICCYQNANDFLLLKKEEQILQSFAPLSQAQVLFFDESALPKDYKIKLPGKHNQQNLSSIFTLGKILNISREKIQASLENFQGVPYRLEKRGERNGIIFINDTTATTPIAAQIALESFPANKIIWIGGGYSKQLPLQNLVKTLMQTAKKIILLEGTGTTELKQELQKFNFEDRLISQIFINLKEAVETAYSQAHAGDIILLSPGFASFGMFVNEFDRGDQFNQIVEKIISQ
ncbi:UDP-N-acetylmuramoyl-L-alanine--D-glutamate ligase [Candidatus Beckwithbacteria bacterium]|nr:UDP-N-acetylmuramoyl-L-alanine--D-glutamate ligase [Candidatus Beckwithbacteria bacterium]